MKSPRTISGWTLGAAFLLAGMLPAAARAVIAAPGPDAFQQLTGAVSAENPSSVTLSPDGNFAYVTSPIVNSAGTSNVGDKIRIFSRNKTTGALTPLSGTAGCVSIDAEAGCVQGRGIDGVRKTVITSDGKFLYAVSGTQDGTDNHGNVLSTGGVAVFSRNTTTGQITQLAGKAGCTTDSGTGGSCNTGIGLRNATDIAIDPQDLNLYVTGRFSDALAVFSRKSSTGQISQTALGAQKGCFTNDANASCTQGRALDGPQAVAVAPDGRSVYVASEVSDAIAVFTRNPTTGVLGQPSGTAGCISNTGANGCAQGSQIDAPHDVTVSGDSKNVYVAAQTSHAITIYSRNATTSALTKLSGSAGCHRDGGGTGCQDTQPLDLLTNVTLSPDDKNVYAASATLNTDADPITIFARDTTTGALTRLPQSAGCVADGGAHGCVSTHNLDGPNAMTFSSDGKFAYVPALQSNAVTIFKRSLDTDQDGFKDTTDNCPTVSNVDQTNSDKAKDGGDACDPDDDNDGIADTADNCPVNVNPSQTDTDGDGKGDVCDPDLDGDGVPNASDNCKSVANADQANNDGDALGDACDPDIDGDGVPNASDNCQFVANADQKDTDSDGIGDACANDIDGDGVPNASDNCPNVRNADQTNTDGDGQGDACDPDLDGDGVANATDNCQSTANADQLDTDHDGQGDACDADDDGDGVPDSSDKCRTVPDPSQADLDGDGVGDACDPDTDGDGVANVSDNCPRVPNPDQKNTDHSGGGNACDTDDDNDGVPDLVEIAHGTSPTSADSDHDGLSDGAEARRGTSPLDADSDDDGIPDARELKIGTNPRRADTDGDGIQDGTEIGVTKPVADPPGPVRGTNLAKFRKDRDPKHKTKPTKRDTDGDGLNDGAEDRNHNGRLDRGETNPLAKDTDGDGVKDKKDKFPRNRHKH